MSEADKRVFYKNEPDFSANELGSTNLIGSSLIRSLLKKLPSAPGVYRMLGGSGDVLYVGKARNLKKRVSSYARRQLDSRRIGLMVSQTVAMEFVITRSEVEALLLEANLIKRFSPRYNILMRDDKSFPCILVTSNHPWPGVFRRRGKVSERGERFGPFASSQSVTQTINTLQRAFLIRTCTDSFFKNRSRPCLLYQIRRCSAPCTGEISMAEYAQLVREAKDFLSGRNQKIKKEISSRMQEASEKLDFEKAAVYRDRLAALSHVQSYQGVDLHGLQDIDVFSIHHDGERSCVQVFFFRGGQNRGGRACFPNADPSIEPEVILASFLAQFYNEERPPPTILSSIRIKEQELLARALSLQAGYSVTIFVPGRGQKKDIVDHALQNAREALIRKSAETLNQIQLLQEFSARFNLPRIPKRIEVYDNSHTTGSSAVGVMIVWGPDGFIKNQYRKFNISSPDIAPGDDYAMMRKVMNRRFGSVDRNSAQIEARGAAGLFVWPDVILVDGGVGQLNAVLEVLKRVDPDETIFPVAIAKGKDRLPGKERFFLRDGTELVLNPRDRVFYFLQRLRDESHRFALGSHRIRRKKEFSGSKLNEISGIGPARKRALLRYFGTLQAISRSGIRDLMLVDGISQALAIQIHKHFHET